ncbi:type I-E CRISPR-associated protein Cse2/CasB [Ponticoccus sp. (in: a-proteobacteria)]|uniref:type I-E CRISPR-associated protein Cse2/CasB n=1 Tax=Ponticoccus sp. (in: a-proteobacteria) TaxID=1925025 RepID=UPI003AB7C4C9
MSEAQLRPGQVILAWWSSELGARATGSQKGLSARLSRGDDVSVLCQLPVHALAGRLGLRDGPRIARLARSLANIREHVPANLPKRLGVGDPKALSPLRFERLIQSGEDDLETAIRRALPMVGHAANVAHLGESLLFWNDKMRTRWCFDYYGAEAPTEANHSKDIAL